MKCPKCDREADVQYETELYCKLCKHAWIHNEVLIDPAELLRLINKAVERHKPLHQSFIAKAERMRWIKALVFDAVKAALEAGDHSALKKLAGA